MRTSAHFRVSVGALYGCLPLHRLSLRHPAPPPALRCARAARLAV